MSPSESASDDDLMRAFQEGSTPAFEELVRRYRARLAAFAESHLRDASAADDVVQETFMRVYEEHRDYIPRGRFKAWVYTIARNLCCDRFRAGARMKFDLDMPLILWTGLAHVDGEPPAPADEPDERLARIRAAAEELPEPLRETVHLRYFHGLRIREVAEIQDCPLGTVKSRLHYALKRIGEAVTNGDSNTEEE